MGLANWITTGWDVVEAHIRRNPRKYGALGFFILVLPQAAPAAATAAKWLWSFVPASSRNLWNQVWAMTLPFSWNWITTPLGLGFMALVWWETRRHRPSAQNEYTGAMLLREGDLESQLDETESDYETTLGERNAALNELQQRTNERDGAQQALKTAKREFAHERLKWYSKMSFGGVKPTVTIRSAAYGNDYAIVQEIQKILKEFTGWEVALDGTNNPMLPQAEKFKVVFESAFTMSFDDVAFAFSDGDLLGVPVGKAMSDREDSHHLVIKVLPSAPA